jgi:hypothetical protein
MPRKQKFIVGRIVKKSTTLYLPQTTACPIRGPWVLRAVVSPN